MARDLAEEIFRGGGKANGASGAETVETEGLVAQTSICVGFLWVFLGVLGIVWQGPKIRRTD